MNRLNLSRTSYLLFFSFFFFFSHCTVNINDDDDNVFNEEDAYEEITSKKESKITRQILEKENKVIEKRNVKGNLSRVKTMDFSMHSGYFKVSGGAKDIAEIIFMYEDTTWKPAMNFIDGEKLKMKMPNRKMENFDLNINEDFSMDESLRSCSVMLGNVFLDELELKLGAGSADFDFNGINIDDLEIELGVGEMKVNLGDASPRNLELDAGIGDVLLDLSGDWENDLEADIQGGIGSLKVLLPRTYNLQIKAGGLLGDINARELNKNGKNYHRKGDKDNNVTLYIDIVGAIGDIELDLE